MEHLYTYICIYIYIYFTYFSSHALGRKSGRRPRLADVPGFLSPVVARSGTAAHALNVNGRVSYTRTKAGTSA